MKVAGVSLYSHAVYAVMSVAAKLLVLYLCIFVQLATPQTASLQLLGWVLKCFMRSIQQSIRPTLSCWQ